MFVNRSSRNSSTEKSVSQGILMEHRKTQRRAAVIGLAVAATVSVVSVTWTRLHAEATTPDTAAARPLSLADAAASDSDLLKQAVAQYKAKQYEDAKATLAQINAANLAGSDQRTLASTGDDVEKAIAGRAEAKARFEEAETKMAGGDLVEAKRLYKSAADSKFVDDGTKQKAREQSAAVDAMQEQQAGEQKAMYQQAKRDFDAGNYAEAKGAFEKLYQSGYKAPMFQGSPSDFLKKIDQKTAVAAETPAKPAEVTPAVAPAVDTKAAEEQAKADKKAAEEAAKAQQQKAKEAYAAGLAALKANDFATARAQFKAADEAGFKPGIFQAPAAKMLAEVDKAEAKAQPVATEQPAQPEAPKAAAPAVQAPAAEAPKAEAPKAEAPKTETPTAATPAAEAPKAEVAQGEAPAADPNAAKQAYAAGLAALKAGDYATARTQFQAADAAGFKPGLFEASAAKMAANVDQAEADAKTKAEKQAADAQAKVDKEAAEAKAKADKQAADEAARAERDAAKAQAEADKTSAATRQVAAREQYKTGLTALKAGDYVAARAGFKAADEAGFKPGLFEATAAKMLAEVDKEEAKAQGKTGQAVAEAPKAETPAVEAPKAETPKVEQPAAETPKPETPKAEVPAVAANPAQSDLEATAKMEQIRQQAKAYDSQRLVDKARQAQQEGRTADALDAYTKAVETDPSNQAAVDGRNQILTLEGRAPVATTLLDRQAQANLAKKQYITYSFNESVDRTRAAIAQHNFKVAQIQLDSAAVARQTDANLFNQDELKAFDTTLAQVQVELKQAQQTFEASEKQRLAEEAQRVSEARQAALDTERRATVAALIKDARRYISQNKYREAMATIDQIVAVDPTNDYATGVRPLVEDRFLLQEQAQYREQYKRNLTKYLNRAEEQQIPYDDIYRYPTNWPEISDDRDKLVLEEQGLGEQDRVVRAALEKKQPLVRFDGTPFDEVIDLLRDTSGVNILVNWKQIEQSGIDRKAPVQARLRDVKLAKVLDVVLAQVSTDPVNKLTYTVDEGVITISTTAELSNNVVTRVYEVTDLMPDITATMNGGGNGGGGGGNIGGTSGGGNTGGGNRGGGGNTGGGGRSSGGGGGGRSSGGGGGGGRSSGSVGGSGGGSNLFGGGGSGGGGGGNGGNGGNTSATMDDITDLIVNTVDVNTWDTAGGTGSIRPFYPNLQLIISQTPEVHRNIENLLAKLRERSAIQVNVETRFLTVSRSFLEDVGMDFQATYTPNSDKWTPINIASASSLFTAAPQTGVPGSLGAQAPAIRVDGAYLDDFQVSFIIRATQATVSQSVVTAPRVTVFNGGTAYVNVSTDRNYVSGFDASTVPGVTGAPQISTVSDGVYLEVSAFVSHDRKYVRLQLFPTLTKLLGIDLFTFQQSASAVAGNTGTVVSSPTLSVQQPVTQTIDLAADVSVPDGGTVLLGGQTIAGEIEREMGVPILSKLPIIKRFFTNRSMAKDESILLILVKPTIIISSEQERKQFPLLSSKISGQ